MSSGSAFSVVVKWCGNEFVFDDLTDVTTLATLKQRISVKTGVRPERQKLLGLKIIKSKTGKYCNEINFWPRQSIHMHALYWVEKLLLLLNYLKNFIGLFVTILLTDLIHLF